MVVIYKSKILQRRKIYITRVVKDVLGIKPKEEAVIEFVLENGRIYLRKETAVLTRKSFESIRRDTHD